MLSFYYLCRTDNNIISDFCTTKIVVICFHFTIFVVLTTTLEKSFARHPMLWFAFILLSLSYWQQPSPGCSPAGGRCDLLSFYYLCRTDNNSRWQVHRHRSVVICFHFTIFVVLTTTALSVNWESFCCDLLSFYYLCRTDNNLSTSQVQSVFVVICFHFTIFVVLTTTNRRFERIESGCDLLSFYYLCRTDNNHCRHTRSWWRVVICFHFTIFVVLTTTESVLFLEFQYVNGNVGTEKMLLLVRCNPVDWRDYIFWLNFRIAPIAARECWRP